MDVAITRRCRGAEYRIAIRNRGGCAPHLTVDGAAIEGTLVPWAPAGVVVNVEVEA